jgi:hypothetical protein
VLTIEIAQGFTIEADEEDQGYQLVGPGGEVSGVTEYGDQAEVEVDGKTYEVTVESRESALTEEQILYLRLDEVPKVVKEEFELEEDEEDEEDEDLDGGQDDDEAA